MACRGVRGATTVDGNDRELILAATRQLLALMIRRNAIDREDVASAIFTTTPDLDAEFPALAARQLGWLEVPLLCGHELAVPGSLPRCIRVLVHWNTDRTQHEIHHIYVRDAVKAAAGLVQTAARKLGRARSVDQRADARARAVVSTFTSCRTSAPGAASGRAAPRRCNPRMVRNSRAQSRRRSQ